MRIVGGMWRGRRLFEPSGSDVTRPTTDRVREAMASMVDSALPEGIEGARVLDAFGGSGALGIEVLSRGAASATFFEADRRAAQLIRKNLDLVGAGAPQARVVAGGTCSLPPSAAGSPGVPLTSCCSTLPMPLARNPWSGSLRPWPPPGRSLRERSPFMSMPLATQEPARRDLRLCVRSATASQVSTSCGWSQLPVEWRVRVAARRYRPPSRALPPRERIPVRLE